MSRLDEIEARLGTAPTDFRGRTDMDDVLDTDDLRYLLTVARAAEAAVDPHRVTHRTRASFQALRAALEKMK